jgi:hypothetical protein
VSTSGAWSNDYVSRAYRNLYVDCAKLIAGAKTPGRATELDFPLLRAFGAQRMPEMDELLLARSIVNPLRDDVASPDTKVELISFLTDAFSRAVCRVFQTPVNDDVIPNLCQDGSHKHALFRVGDPREREYTIPLRCVFCQGVSVDEGDNLRDARYVALIGCNFWNHIACLSCYIYNLGRTRFCPHAKCRESGPATGMVVPATPAALMALSFITTFARRGIALPFSRGVGVYPQTTVVFVPPARLYAALFSPSLIPSPELGAAMYYEDYLPLAPLAAAAAAAPAPASPTFDSEDERDSVTPPLPSSPAPAAPAAPAVAQLFTPARQPRAAVAPGAPGRPIRRMIESPPPPSHRLSAWDAAFNPQLGGAVNPLISTQPSLEDAPIEYEDEDPAPVAAAAPAPVVPFHDIALVAFNASIARSAAAAPFPAAAAAAAAAPAELPEGGAGSKRRRGLREVSALLVDNAPDRVSRSQAREMAQHAQHTASAAAAAPAPPRTRAAEAREVRHVMEVLAELDELDADGLELDAMEDAEATAKAVAEKALQ